jgi:hypothetical protein
MRRIIAVAVLALAACSHSYPVLDEDGTYYQATSSSAGTYTTEGSARANGRPCSWQVLSADWSHHTGITAVADSQIAHGNAAVGQAGHVTVAPGQYFVSYGCKPWHHD